MFDFVKPCSPIKDAGYKILGAAIEIKLNENQKIRG